MKNLDLNQRPKAKNIHELSRYLFQGWGPSIAHVGRRCHEATSHRSATTTVLIEQP